MPKIKVLQLLAFPPGVARDSGSGCHRVSTCPPGHWRQQESGGVQTIYQKSYVSYTPYVADTFGLGVDRAQAHTSLAPTCSDTVCLGVDRAQVCVSMSPSNFDTVGLGVNRAHVADAVASVLDSYDWADGDFSFGCF